MITPAQIQEIESASLPEAVRLISDLFPGKVVFSSSLGQEDQVLTDVIYKHKLSVKIFTIDTGRLFPETYDLIEKTVARYNQQLRVYFPESSDVENYVANAGVNGFYESIENRKSCCHIRKVKPLERALQGSSVWMTGLRAGQSGNRKSMQMIEWSEEKQLYKFNPLIHWSMDAVLEYISTHQVPYNVLHDQSFPSIGCAPCTRAVMPGEDARAGRWWWETSQKECGLHSEVIRAEV